MSGSRAKADFGHVYDQADPRDYYGALQEVDYATPAHACGVFERCVDALRELRDLDTVTVLDLCCGYGVNAALLNHRVGLADLYDHYTRDATAALDPWAMAAVDLFYYRASAAPRARVYGVDVAANALAYAEQVDLLERGFAANLEREAPDEALAEVLAEVDLVTVTGGLSYIGERTFSRVLDGADQGPWVACYPLRTSDFSAVAGTLASFGFRDERWDGETIAHRRFVDDAEQQRVVAQARDLGLDVDGREADGWYHAELHLARPAAEVDAVPLARLVEG